MHSTVSIPANRFNLQVRGFWLGSLVLFVNKTQTEQWTTWKSENIEVERQLQRTKVSRECAENWINSGIIETRKGACSQTTRGVSAFRAVHYRVKTLLSVSMFPHFSCCTYLDVGFYSREPGADLPFHVGVRGVLLRLSRLICLKNECSIREMQEYWYTCTKNTQLSVLSVCRQEFNEQ